MEISLIELRSGQQEGFQNTWHVPKSVCSPCIIVYLQFGGEPQGMTFRKGASQQKTTWDIPQIHRPGCG